MHLDDLTGADVLVLGLGIDNLAVLDSVVAAGPQTLRATVDDLGGVSESDHSTLAALGIELVSSEQAVASTETTVAQAAAAGPDGSPGDGSPIVLRAPGYPRRGELCTRLERVGARFTTAVDLWMGTHGPARPVVAITGTKGKSTVTALLDSLLDLLGIEHVMGGNIGLAIWAEAPDPAPGVPAVIEVSSYMAADAHRAPMIGVLTSLDADHLTWHGSIEAYRDDKLRLFTCGAVAPQVVLVNGEDPVAAEALAGTGLTIEPVLPGQGLARLAAARLAERGFPRHLGSNLALAAAAAQRLCDVMGVPSAQLEAALAELANTYEALPSRHATIGEHRGVRYIDDALASNPFAAAAALDAVGEVPVTWLIGGQSREVSLAPMAAALAVRSSPTLVLGLPDTGAAWCAELTHASDPVGDPPNPGQVEVAIPRGIEEAVHEAEARTPPGGVVLFAPGAPTPTRLGTYLDRAAAFAAAFEALSGATAEWTE